MKKLYFLIFSIVLLVDSTSAQVKDPASFVNPFIGTDFHGHTYPGATVPFGMVQLSPDTRLTGWDGCSAYHYSDSIVYGFSHTHLSGTGCSDYGDILLIPVTGKPEYDNKNYSSPFSKKTEIAKPGYYSVFLDKYKTRVELTATTRTGFHKYTFPKTKEANVILDLEHRDKVIESWIQVIGKNEIRGFRRSKEWAEDQQLYFVIRFSTPFEFSQIRTGDESQMIVDMGNDKPGLIKGINLKGSFNFRKLKNNQLQVKVGLSAVSVEGAIKNLESENPGWDFEKVREDAYHLWNKELTKIGVEGGTVNQLTTFYTSLYHCMVVPNVYSDVDGMYRAMDKKVYKAEGFNPYTVFSLWDTYRAWHPLMTIIDTKRTNDYINTFLSHYRYGGLLPVWELSANETYCMIGYHSVPVIVDAWMKNIRNFDAKYAFEAMKHSSNLDHHGLASYRKYGYIPGDKDAESVSRTLEYSYDDWCIAQFAKQQGNEDDYKEYITRAQYYKNLFDPETKFMRPKLNGGWKISFDPTEVDNNFTEANSWQYSFYVPHDLKGLIKLHGGAEQFEAKLDELFSTSSSLSGRQQSDITGLIGQYAHGNEPSHHMAYLYNYVGKPQKTQKLVRKILDEMYSHKPDGLCGNEDCGQMSAWYVLSAMGLYQVCPGSNQYVIGSPLFGKAQINLENGSKFIISAENNSKENIYIKEAYLNGNPIKRSWISHQEIMAGGELKLVMSSTPDFNWATEQADCPSTSIDDYPLLQVPYFDKAPKSFTDSLALQIKTIIPNATVYYSVLPVEGEVEPVWIKGTAVLITSNSRVKAYALSADGNKSHTIEGKFFKVATNKKISIKSKYSNLYNGGGPECLIDGIRGESNFRLGGWQGYNNQDFECVIDLGQVKPVHKLSAGFLQDIGPWIWLPKYVEFWASDDGERFNKITTVTHEIPDNDYKVILKDIEAKVDISTRYIKVFAKGYGTIPEWHLGSGNPSWVFVDEIIVE